MGRDTPLSRMTPRAISRYPLRPRSLRPPTAPRSPWPMRSPWISGPTGPGVWWHVWSQIWSFPLAYAPAAPALYGPADGASFSLSQAIPLDWGDVPGATLYHVQVDEDQAFGSPEVDATPTHSEYTILAGRLHAPALDGALATTRTHYWRVSARNAVGQGPWSATRRLLIADSYLLMLPEVHMR